MNRTAQLLRKARAQASSGDYREACRTYLSATRAEPKNVTIWTELGATLNAANRPGDALQALGRAGDLNPQHVPALVEAAKAEMKLGHPQRAAAALQRATALEPKNAAVLRELAIALHAANAGPASLGAIERAHQLAPDDPETTLVLGMMLCEFGALQDGLPHLRKAAEQKPGARQLAVLANCLSSTSLIEEASEVIERAASLDPRFPGVPSTRAKIAEAMGRPDEAVRIAEDAILQGCAPPDLLQKYADLMRQSPERGKAIDLLRGALASSHSTDPGALHQVWLGLGSLLDAECQYKEAFECFKKGKDLGAPPFNPQIARNRTETLRRAFSRDALASLPKGDPSERRPAFIVGMPRSGTTLLERIIGAHPDAAGAGELDVMPRLFATLPNRLGVQGFPPDALKLLSPRWISEIAGEYSQRLAAIAPRAARVVDKLPHNFLQVGFISVLFPGAAILHSSRHPLDTCLSCFMTPLSPAHAYSFSLAGLVVEYNEYRRLMAHWKDILGDRITEVVYENVVANLDAEARRVIAALGLPWNDACLEFHTSAGPVVTASANQVRRPIYDSSTNRWKNYEPYIGELIDGLRQFL